VNVIMAKEVETNKTKQTMEVMKAIWTDMNRTTTKIASKHTMRVNVRYGMRRTMKEAGRLNHKIRKLEKFQFSK
jgi:hypothetical protein